MPEKLRYITCIIFNGSAATRFSRGPVLATLSVLLFLAGCASQNLGYHHAVAPGDFGYRNSAITNHHYLVSYTGNYGLARSTVDKFALFRAAELTLAHDHDRFRIVSRETSPVTKTRSLSNTNFGMGWVAPYWAPPYIGTEAGFPVTVSSKTRYESVLDIQIGPKVPKNGSDVYNAREVKRHLAPTVAGGA